jgi:hypothetical protein
MKNLKEKMNCNTCDRYDHHSACSSDSSSSSDSNHSDKKCNHTDKDCGCKNKKHNKKEKHCTDTDCINIKKDYCPVGVKMIKGSGRLFAIGANKHDNFMRGNFNNHPKHLAELADGYCPPTFKCGICVKKCCDFEAAKCINYVNGDLIINVSDCDDDCKDGQFKHLAKFYNGRREQHDIFPELIGINGSLYIIGTDLVRLSGFRKLEYVVGDIVIVNNPNLISHPTFPSLITIGRKNKNNEHFHGNHGKKSHTSQDTDSDCSDNCDCDNDNCNCDSKSTNIKGSGRVIIGNNNVLRKVIGFEAVIQISAGVYILENDCLTQICGFINLLRTDDIVINKNRRLHKILAFCYLELVSHYLFITCNNTDGDCEFFIDSFHNLEVTGKIIIAKNYDLKVFSLPKLVNVENVFVVEKNRELEVIKSNNLRYAGTILIRDNYRLCDIEFKSVETIDQGLYIENNTMLEKIDSFNNLKRVDQSIHIIGNKNLCSVTGFDCLHYIGSNMYDLADCAPNHCNCDHHCDCDNDTCKSTNWKTFCGECYDITVKKSRSGCKCEEDVKCTDNTGCQVLNYTPILCPITLPKNISEYLCSADKQCQGKKCGGCNGCGDRDNSDCSDHSDHSDHTDSEHSDHSDRSNHHASKKIKSGLLTSLVIYDNNRLRQINSFNELKYVESSIFIVRNKYLEEIKSFNKLEFVLDLWVRNNPLVKYICAFAELKSARAISILETICLKEFIGFGCLKHVEYILAESRSSKVFKGLKKFTPSVHGSIIYYKN